MLLRPSSEGTVVLNASSMQDVNDELNAGFTMADAIIPYTKPHDVGRISEMSL